tara:strand:+ start:226064 stop:226372 length:309 start_codon:yes stop_codon:yes gene_type:complete
MTTAPARLYRLAGVFGFKPNFGGTMGSLFSTPTPNVTTPVQTASDTTVADDGETAAEASRRARTEALERRRYGRAGLIGTSFRGLLTDRITQAAGGKNLLGE